MAQTNVAPQGQAQAIDLNRESTQQMFPLPVGMKIAIAQVAQEREMSVAALIRAAVAADIGYELPPSRAGSSRKYANPEERKAAQRDRNKAKRDEVRELLKSLTQANGTADGDADDDEDEDEDDS